MARLFRKTFIDQYEKHQTLSLILPERAFRFFKPIAYLFCGFMLVLVLWMLFARIEVHVKAKGMILPIGGIRESVSLGDGRVVKSFDYENGDIESGDPILILSDPIAENAYLSAMTLYQSELEVIKAEEKKAQAKYDEQLKLYQQKITNSKDKISRLKDLKATFEDVLVSYKRVGKSSLKDSKVELAKTKQTYKRYISKLKALQSKGYSSERTLIPLLSKYEELAQSLSTLEEAKPKLNLNITQQEQQIATIDDDITQQYLEIQTDLNTIEQGKFERQASVNKIALKQQKAVQALIKLEHKNWVQQNIFTEYDGKLIDTKKRVGQVVSKGETITLLSVKVQKKKKMLIVSPRARYGHFDFKINRKLTSVYVEGANQGALLDDLKKQLAALDDLSNVKIKGDSVVFEFNENQVSLKHYQLHSENDIPVFSSLETVGENWTNDQLVNIAILRYQDAKLVNKGDTALIQPLYEKAIIGAKLSAKIQSISPFALTKVQSYSLVGDKDLASKIIGDVPGEVVILSLDKTATGAYDWGGRKPVRPISPGVPTSAIITIDELAPIEVIIPYIARIFIGRSY
ncbi:hypothetical protein D5018_14005 [Parashewanella curva]|uniref:HlyD family efflux transporter periplasmic adaptor subunit n=1 Tax=Parashewanella curva TaxID=2338552 RepID=A0A3L8PUQ6_9GAMM|nr:hypothetical protein [Parashewanella curva]RLV59060.1 hypothetical protein D5018_14005 [Parashewanella curva]